MRVMLELVLALIVTNVDVLDREADKGALCFTVLLVDAEFEMLDDVEDLEPTELVDEAGDPWREDEEEGRW